MKTAWEEIKRLIHVNAKHRAGWRLADVDALHELKDTAKELIELANTSSFDEELEELADVFSCLIGFAQKSGYTLEEIETALIRKLKERFTE